MKPSTNVTLALGAVAALAGASALSQRAGSRSSDPDLDDVFSGIGRALRGPGEGLRGWTVPQVEFSSLSPGWHLALHLDGLEPQGPARSTTPPLHVYVRGNIKPRTARAYGVDPSSMRVLLEFTDQPGALDFMLPSPEWTGEPQEDARLLIEVLGPILEAVKALAGHPRGELVTLVHAVGELEMAQDGEITPEHAQSIARMILSDYIHSADPEVRAAARVLVPLDVELRRSLQPVRGLGGRRAPGLAGLRLSPQDAKLLRYPDSR